MPEHILPLPPKWEKDLDCGWVVFKSGEDDIRGYFAKPKGRSGLPGLVMAPENFLGSSSTGRTSLAGSPRPVTLSLPSIRTAVSAANLPAISKLRKNAA